MELDNSAIGLIIIILTLVTVMFVVFTNYNEINYLKTKIDKLTAITNELSAASEVVTEICSTIEDEEIDNYQGTGEEYIENLEDAESDSDHLFDDWQSNQIILDTSDNLSVILEIDETEVNLRELEEIEVNLRDSEDLEVNLRESEDLEETKVNLREPEEDKRVLNLFTKKDDTLCKKVFKTGARKGISCNKKTHGGDLCNLHQIK